MSQRNFDGPLEVVRTGTEGRIRLDLSVSGLHPDGKWVFGPTGRTYPWYEPQVDLEELWRQVELDPMTNYPPDEDVELRRAIEQRGWRYGFYEVGNGIGFMYGPLDRNRRPIGGQHYDHVGPPGSFVLVPSTPPPPSGLRRLWNWIVGR